MQHRTPALQAHPLILAGADVLVSADEGVPPAVPSEPFSIAAAGFLDRFQRYGAVTPAAVQVNRVPRPVPVILLLVGSALAIAACGSSSPIKAAGNARPQFLAYVDCLRSHGVPNLPDPGPEGAIELGPGSAINASSPSFKAAQARCAKLAPSGGPGGPARPSEQAKAQMLAVSECMRAHGVSGFPDPTLGPPPSNPLSFSIAMGRDGVSLLVPKTINVSSPAFKQAATTCRFGALLAGGHRSPAP